MQKNLMSAAIASTLANTSAGIASTLANTSAGIVTASPAAGDIMAPKSDAELEQKIEALKPTAPRLTKELIQAVIVDETYTRLEGTRTTVCRLQLVNGFCVVGINNGPVSAPNFDQEIGCEYAYKAAVDQIWPLEGYLLAERLHQLAQAPKSATHVAKPVHVTARKIVDVKGTTPWGDELPANHARLELDDGTSYEATPEMTVRYWPTAGDYLVRQEDGYAYLNPADVFERKYSAIK